MGNSIVNNISMNSKNNIEEIVLNYAQIHSKPKNVSMNVLRTLFTLIVRKLLYQSFYG